VIPEHADKYAEHVNAHIGAGICAFNL